MGAAPPLGAQTLVGSFSSASHAHVGDGNGDGVADVFVADLGDLGVDPSIPGIYYVQGEGNHEFAEPVQLPGGGFQGLSVVSGAVADGVVDIAGAGFVEPRPGVYAAEVRFWRGNGDGTWSAPTILPSMSGWFVELIDVNTDDRLDMLGHFDGARVALASDDESFADFTEYGSFARLHITGTDLDNDGDVDLVYGTHWGFAVLMGDGSGSFGAATYVDIGTEAVGLVTGDFNGDGNADVASINSNTVRVFAGDGAGNLAAGLELRGPLFPFRLAAPDYDADGCADLTTFSNGTSEVFTWMGRDDFAFEPPGTFFVENDGALVGGAAGDLDDDGIADVVVTIQAGFPGSGAVFALFSSD